MQKHHSRLPIFLILITLLSFADWTAAAASSRLYARLPGGSHTGLGWNSTFSGEPDAPGVSTGTGTLSGSTASGRSSIRVTSGDVRSLAMAGIWIRMLQVRLFGY